MSNLTRRTALQLGVAAIVTSDVTLARAEEKVLTIGMSVPLTGANAKQARVAANAAQFGVNEVNRKGGVAGYQLRLMVLDDGSTNTGQYDPAISATNARRMVNDPNVIASVGPLNSGSAKAMCPVLSQAQMALISASATNPDLNDPKFFAVYHPGGKPNFFRTVTTDAYQGPGLANYFAEVLNLKKVVVLDDTGAYGVGMANAFAAQAAKKGMEVTIRDRVDPLNSDYSPVLTRAKSLNVDALYFGGDALAGIKVVKQSYDILPKVVKGGGDGVHTPDMITGSGMPAINAWYATSAATHVLDDPKLQPWIKRYRDDMHEDPADYTVTYDDAIMVIADAIRRVAESKQTMTRDAVRAAMLTTKMNLLQGEVAFDANGDLASKVVSIFQVAYDSKYGLGDMVHQFRFVGPAPAV